MQNRTMMYHFTLVRMAVSKNLPTINSGGEMWRKGNPLALLSGMQIDTASTEKCMDISLKKTGSKTTI